MATERIKTVAFGLLLVHYCYLEQQALTVLLDFRYQTAGDALYWLRWHMFVIHPNVLKLVFVFRGKGSSVSSASAPYKLEHHLLFRLKRLWGETSIEDKDGGVAGGREMVIKEPSGFYLGSDTISERKTGSQCIYRPLRQDKTSGQGWTLKKLKHVNQCIPLNHTVFLVFIHFLFDVWHVSRADTASFWQ